jgi:hypothetical protein
MRPTGDPSQRSRLSLTLLETPLFQWLGPLLLMWMSLWMTLWVWLRSTLLEAVDEVFRPLSPTDPPTRREPISVKKLLEGDGSDLGYRKPYHLTAPSLC